MKPFIFAAEPSFCSDYNTLLFLRRKSLVRLQFDTLLGWLVPHACVCVPVGVYSAPFRSETWVVFCESSVKDPRKLRESGFDCKGEVLSERRACQYTSLVLESCDFKLELHGLRKAVSFQPVHVMYYPCDESCDFTAGVGESNFAHYAGT